MKSNNLINLKLFKLCRSIDNVSIKEFSSHLKPPVSQGFVSLVLLGKRKSKRVEKAINDFIRLYSNSIGLSSLPSINSTLKKTKISISHNHKQSKKDGSLC